MYNCKFKNIFKECLEKWGFESQSNIMIEEMSELTKALMKMRRAKHDITLNEVLNELVDVQITLECLLTHYSNKQNNEYMIRQYNLKIEHIKSLLNANS